MKFILLNSVRYIIFSGLVSVLFMSAGLCDSDPALGPGDRKEGYYSTQYRTDSLSLISRIGRPADLLAFLQDPPLGLPPVPEPDFNRATRDKIQLGRRMFYDRRLSFNDTFSCAICHIPEQGFTNNEISRAVGVEGRSGKRNSPSIYNVAYLARLFHDGRENTLEQQAWAPLLAHNEMGNPSIGYVVEKVQNLRDYDGLFETAFNGQGPSMTTIAHALAAYQRTLISANSRFDRWYYASESNLLSQQEIKGFEIFRGKGGCSACHLINEDYATFTDNQLHNTGMGYIASMGSTAEKKKILIAPGIFMEVSQEMIDSVTKQVKENDLGLYEITQDPEDRWKFRTPSLRNVALTRPYMHNGSLQTLKEVVEFYNQGGIQNKLLSPIIKPLGLSDDEIDALVAFMHTLTGSNVKTLVYDAFAAPIGDLKSEDPHWSQRYDFVSK